MRLVAPICCSAQSRLVICVPSRCNCQDCIGPPSSKSTAHLVDSFNGKNCLSPMATTYNVSLYRKVTCNPTFLLSFFITVSSNNTPNAYEQQGSTVFNITYTAPKVCSHVPIQDSQLLEHTSILFLIPQSPEHHFWKPRITNVRVPLRWGHVDRESRARAAPSGILHGDQLSNIFCKLAKSDTFSKETLT